MLALNGICKKDGQGICAEQLQGDVVDRKSSSAQSVVQRWFSGAGITIFRLSITPWPAACTVGFDGIIH
jgi:hypothetical protein